MVLYPLDFLYILNPEPRAFVLDGVLVPPRAVHNVEDGGHGQATLHRPQAGCLSPPSGLLSLL